MQLDTALRLVIATKEIFPASKNDIDTTADAWMALFGGKDDGLMETAIRSCWLGCKFWPTPADITEAIKDLQYVEQTKPKQLAWEVPRTNEFAQKMADLTSGKTDTKAYLQALDISKQITYAKQFFPDISPELVLRNISEFMQGMEQQEKCFACRMQKQACDGWRITHYLDFKTGYVKNEMAKCNKQVRS